MARLYRPAIPVHVKCRVVLRQLGEMWPERVIAEHPRGLARLLDTKLAQLAAALHCEVIDLRLDHDPPLGAREQIKARPPAPYAYCPDANDPEHLKYRPHGTQFTGSHDIKTRVRGDHGQYSDIVLIKRQRRREKKAAAAKMRNKLPKFKARRKVIRCRWKWPKRKLQKRRKP